MCTFSLYKLQVKITTVHTFLMLGKSYINSRCLVCLADFQYFNHDLDSLSYSDREIFVPDKRKEDCIYIPENGNLTKKSGVGLYYMVTGTS